MKELIILMATTVPESTLLRDLKEAIEEHFILETEDTKKYVYTLALMLVIKLSTSGEIDKATQMIDELNNIEKIKNLFTTNNN